MEISDITNTTGRSKYLWLDVRVLTQELCQSLLLYYILPSISDEFVQRNLPHLWYYKDPEQVEKNDDSMVQEEGPTEENVERLGNIKIQWTKQVME